jgi:hypothetical protein
MDVANVVGKPPDQNRVFMDQLVERTRMQVLPVLYLTCPVHGRQSRDSPFTWKATAGECQSIAAVNSISGLFGPWVFASSAGGRSADGWWVAKTWRSRMLARYLFGNNDPSAGGSSNSSTDSSVRGFGSWAWPRMRVSTVWRKA